MNITAFSKRNISKHRRNLKIAEEEDKMLNSITVNTNELNELSKNLRSFI